MRSIVASAVAVLIAGSLGGCSMAACSVPLSEAPHVAVYTEAWFEAHPESSVEVCFDGACQTVAEATAVRLSPRSGDHTVHPTVARDFSVTITALGHTQVRDRRLGLRRTVSPPSPCGLFVSWTREVTVTANGQVDVGETDDGRG
jgi:hypothetical protein